MRISWCRWIGVSALLMGCSSSADEGRLSSGSSMPSGDEGADYGDSDGASTDPGIPVDESPSPSVPAAGPGESSGAAGSGSAPRESGKAPPSDGSDGSDNNQGVSAGTLTSGVWDDNRNFSRFLGYRSGLAAAGLAGMMPVTEEELKEAHELWLVPPVSKKTLDVSLIIDTTGSMGDEIRYLQSEFMALSNSISEAHPNADQRWSLVLYRDTADEYVTRVFDFRSDTEDFRSQLAKQSAAGGGDTPEAPERAFDAAKQLTWRTQNSTARLAFWVADAPHHNDRAAQMATALRAMKALDVHVYPVAASGVDELTEVSMRTAAAVTGGRYLFLTNDSGVGGDHKEPTIPCYFVTKLNTAIARMVDIELSGEYREPAARDVIRKGGDPHDGACTLDSGEVTHAF